MTRLQFAAKRLDVLDTEVAQAIRDHQATGHRLLSRETKKRKDGSFVATVEMELKG